MESPREFYDENGYFIFRKALPLQLLRDVNRILDVEIRPNDVPLLRHKSHQHEPHVYHAGTRDRRITNGLLDAHREPATANLGRALLNVICSEALTACLRNLDGEESYTVHQTILFFVGPDTGPHIDAWGLETVPHGSCHTVWIPFEPVNRHNAPIYVVPWKRGRFLDPQALGISDSTVKDSSPDRAFYFSYQERLARHIEQAAPAQVIPDLDPGDFIVFSSLTPHGTLPAPEKPSRVSMQVLVRPSRLPWNDLHSMLRGDASRNEAGDVVLNDSWRAI